MGKLACALLARGAALSLATIAAGQAVSDPNQVVGTIGYTNRNRAVLQVLDARPLTRGRVGATSRPPAPGYSHASNMVVTGSDAGRYEVTVESDLPGIVYGIGVDAYRGNDLYRFLRADSGAVLPEPAPDVSLDLAECAGVLHLRFRDSRGRPRAIDGGSLRSTVPNGFDTYLHAGDTEAWLIVRGSDVPIHAALRLVFGSDPFSDLLVQEATIEVVVPCDEIVEMDFQCRGAGDDVTALPKILGVVDLLGVAEVPITNPFFYWGNYTSVWASGGPWGNARYDKLNDRNPSSGAFELENLMPSDVVSPPQPYGIGATARHGMGRSAGWFTWPGSGEFVTDGQVLDLGDRYVTDPARLAVEVDMSMSPTRAGMAPILATLVGSGAGSATTSSEGRETLLGGARFGGGGGGSIVGIDGAVDADATSWIGRGELLLGGLDGETTAWSRPALQLELETAGTDEASHVAEDLRLYFEAPDVVAAPADSISRSMHACMSEVNLGFRSTSGTFFAPTVEERRADFDGVDDRGRPVRYVVYVDAGGTPLTMGDAAARGNVRMALPAADYVIIPRVTAVNPGGGTSSTQLPDVHLRVGCRQIIDLVPELQTVVAETPPCTGTGPVRVTGSVSGVRPVALVESSVNGSAWSIVCRDCGMNPTFAFDVAPPAEDAAIAVRSTDAAGDVATTTAHSRFAEEPSALDLRPGAPPLRVRRSGDHLELEWESLGAPANVYVGTLESLARTHAYDHASAGACDVGAGATSLAMPAADSYVLIGGSCAWGDGSLGRDSMGRERPGAMPRCD